MVFYNVYNFVTSYLWYGGTELENQKLRNEPIKVIGISAETLQEKIRSLKKVDTKLADLIREDIEFNNSRTDHIRTDDDIKNNKPLSKMEMDNIKAVPIKVFDCISSDLRDHIKNLKNVEISDELIETHELTLFDEINAITDLQSWFNSRKK